MPLSGMRVLRGESSAQTSVAPVDVNAADISSDNRVFFSNADTKTMTRLISESAKLFSQTPNHHQPVFYCSSPSGQSRISPAA
jgi:hypothetical protein